MSYTYHFGVPGSLIWTSHILFGLFFIYLGYLIQEQKPVSKFIGTSLIVLGSIMILYHSHLWYYQSHQERQPQKLS
jgi:disulfide bond formation protein DsbB